METKMTQDGQTHPEHLNKTKQQKTFWKYQHPQISSYTTEL